MKPGYASNFQADRISNNIYFTALVETAAWGAELATALAGSDERSGWQHLLQPGQHQPLPARPSRCSG